METSDSDYFESADEDFYSDEDNNPSVLVKQDIQYVTGSNEKRENLKLDHVPPESEQPVRSENLDVNKTGISSDSSSRENNNDAHKTAVSDLRPTLPLDSQHSHVQHENLDNKNQSRSEDGKNSNKNEATKKSELNSVKGELVDLDNKNHSRSRSSHCENTNKNEVTKNFDLMNVKREHDSCSKFENNQKRETDPTERKLKDIDSEKTTRVNTEIIIGSNTKIDDTAKCEKIVLKENTLDDSWNNDGWDIDDDGIDDTENLWNKDEICWDNKKVQPSEVNMNIATASNITKEVTSEDTLMNNGNNSDLASKLSGEDYGGDNKSSNDGWGAWGNWEVTSLISTATQSVSALTSQVSQGLSTALETGMGIPNPEELAKEHIRGRVHEDNNLEKQSTDDNIASNLGLSSSTFGFGLSNLVSGVSNITKFVESTGTKVISGGLDTLETIGKKTMEVLQEGDPGLRKKRSFLQLEPNKPVLSQVLKEAKLKAEQEEKKTILEKQIPKKNYEQVFDDYHGLVHLEALEMLSKQCEIKLQMLMENCDVNSVTEIQETLDQVRELCELPDEDDEEQVSLEDIREKLKSAVQDLNVNITYDKLLSSWGETEGWLTNLKLNVCDENEIHQQAIETLAQLTAIAMEQYHKAGELLLIKDHRSTADEADSLVQLTTTLTSLIGIVAGKFSEKLNMKVSNLSNKEEVNGLITNVFFEAANSSSYIQDAFQLLVPVLQVGAV